MKRSKFSEEQVAYARPQAESGTPVGDAYLASVRAKALITASNSARVTGPILFSSSTMRTTTLAHVSEAATVRRMGGSEPSGSNVRSRTLMLYVVLDQGLRQRQSRAKIEQIAAAKMRVVEGTEVRLSFERAHSAEALGLTRCLL